MKANPNKLYIAIGYYDADGLGRLGTVVTETFRGDFADDMDRTVDDLEQVAKFALSMVYEFTFEKIEVFELTSPILTITN